LRAWVEQWSGLEGDELKEKLFRWFGSDDKEPKDQQKDSQAGGLIFSDAIPIEQVTLTCDIMTPHMGVV
jgi:CRISPR-associated protein Cmr6